MFNWVRSLDQFLRQTEIRYLGLGLLLAWVYGSWFSNGIFPAGSPQMELTLRASLGASAVGLLVLAFRPRKRTPLGARLILGAAAVMAASTFSFFFLDGIAPLVAASVLGGFASAVLWVAWGELFCQIDTEVTESCIPSSLVMFVAAVLLSYLLPVPVSGILACLYPVLSCLMLLLGKSAQPVDFSFEQPAEPFSQVLPSLMKLAFCSMACSLATGCVVTSFMPDDLLIDVDDFILFYVAGGVLAGCIAAFAIAHTSKISFSFLYEWAVPIIVCSLALRALDEPMANTVASVLACTAALYVEVQFFAIFSRITAQGFCLPSETFGIFRAVVQLGFLLGGLLGTLVNHADGLPIYLGLICLCVVILPLFLHLQKRFDVPWEHQMKAAEALLAPATNEPDVVGELAAEYKLSPRETEVLRFLAKGRSVPYMREVMTISKSTIETHIKHIYAKTDVHSKQELLDLIESHTIQKG